MGLDILRAYRFVKNLPANLRVIRSSIHELEVKMQSTSDNLGDVSADLKKASATFDRGIDDIRQRQSDMAHAIANLGQTSIPAAGGSQASSAPGGLQATNHALDGYYLAFETKFRGSEEDIYQRLKESYTDIFNKRLSKDLKKMPVVDIGCGRGEMLHLLQELKLKGVGIDLNRSMVERCKQNGYEAYQQDAVAYLRKQKSSSLAAIVGIHIVEHIPFEQLIELLQECYRTVAPGGFVFFETPNAENVVVGSLSFWYDTSHLKPIPPEALAFMLQYVGFGTTEIMRMHPDQEAPKKISSEAVQKIADKLYGPRDYAAVGYKSAPR